jgi:hypothetical protein
MIQIFEENDKNELITRSNQLTNESQAQWGKMDVSQMLAHCNVAFEMVYENIHPKPGAIKQFMLKLFVKSIVVGDKPYQKNGRTAPEFIISSEKEFEKEKKRLINYINKTYELGSNHFEGKDSHSFGKLSKKEWNNMLVKHLDHHFKQFGI